MPPLPLALTIQAGIPWLSPQGRAVISALVAANGQIEATAMAGRIRAGSRYRLARLLRREGLPPFGRLADWIFVLQTVWEAESTGTPLLRVARRLEIEPATCYRRCRRTLGVSWSSARTMGFAWALVRFLQHCPRPGTAITTGLDLPVHPVHSTTAAVPVPSGSGRILPRGRTAMVRPVRPAARIMLSQTPTDVAVSGSNAVYVTCAYGATVERLDLTARRSVSSIPVGVNPTRIVFDASGRLAYVSNQFGGSISVIDATADSVVDDIPVPGDPAPLLAAPDRQTLYVATNLDRLYAVDTRRRRIVAEAPLPATSHHLAMHPDRRRVFVATRAAGSVLELDARSLERRRVIGVDGLVQALACDRTGAELYVANEAGWVDVLRLQTGEVTASLRLEAGAYGLCLSPDDARLYVTLPSAGRLVVIDRETLRLELTILTGGTPRHTVFLHDGRTALVVNEAGWVDVVK
ncbi:MAG TPA: YncE family protein [Gemmatimonadales bacterium]|nr:YncE family protein [Gemmatimonadales bacterium]